MDKGLHDLLQPSLDPVFLAIILVIVGFLFSGYYKFKSSSSNGKKLPPGSLGLPLFGETISFLRSQKHDKTQEWVDTRIAKHGPIFKTSLMGKPTAVITGSSGNRFVFSANDNTIGSSQPSTITSIIGKYNIFELTENVHKITRGAMNSFLKPESLQRYVGEMDSVIKQALFLEFNGKDTVTVVPLMKRIAFKVTCKLLFALPSGKEEDSLFGDLTAALKGLWSLHIDLPTTTFHRAMAARRRIYNYFSRLIQERRWKLAQGDANVQDDVISAFIKLRNENEEDINDDLIIDNVMALMIASHDTSAIVLSHVVRHLARDEAVYKLVEEEQEKILGEKEGIDGKLTWNDVQKMKYTWRVVQEQMRILPPVFGTFKRATTDTSFGGFDIPKGWQVFWVASSTHMDESIFPEPKKFDPSRFEANSKSYPPYSYIPFGAGPRICPGSDFARIEVLLIMHHLVSNYRWSEMIPNEPITRDPMPYPAMGLPIKLHPKRNHEDVCT